jgi:hypothetical protein
MAYWYASEDTIYTVLFSEMISLDDRNLNKIVWVILKETAIVNGPYFCR